MPHGDMRRKQNKARLGEPGRGIIQFEIFFRFAKESFAPQGVKRLSRYCLPQLSRQWTKLTVLKQFDTGKDRENGTK